MDPLSCSDSEGVVSANFVLCAESNDLSKAVFKKNTEDNFWLSLSTIGSAQLIVPWKMCILWCLVEFKPHHSSDGCGNPIAGIDIFFSWLLLNDRLDTPNILRRKKRCLSDYSCVLCNGNFGETLEHMLAHCTFSQWCWCLTLGPLVFCNFDMVQDGRQRFSSPISKEIFILVTWTIRCHRKSIVFNAAVPSLGRWKQAFKSKFCSAVCTK